MITESETSRYVNLMYTHWNSSSLYEILEARDGLDELRKEVGERGMAWNDFAEEVEGYLKSEGDWEDLWRD
jgi:hypothetical protein